MYATFTRLRALALIVATLGLAACNEAGWSPDDNGGGDNGGGGGGGGGNPDRNYFGPDSSSVWELNLAFGGNFTLTKKTNLSDSNPNPSLEGSYTELSSGFTRLTVNNSPGASINSQIPALDIAGYAVIFAPPETASSQLVAAIASGTCNASIVGGNWIQYKFSSATDSTDTEQYFFGTWRYEPSTNRLLTPDRYNLTNEFSLGTTEEGINIDCDEGFASDDSSRQYLSANASLVSNNENDASLHGFRFGMPEDQFATTVSFEGNYLGFMYDNATQTTQTIAATCESSGECRLFEVADIATITRSTITHNLNLNGSVDHPKNGFITGSLVDSNNNELNGNISCMVNVDINSSGKNLLSCVGQYPQAALSAAVNIFLYSEAAQTAD